MSNPDHSQYCNCECPEGISYDKLERTLNRVRMVHVKQIRDGETFCTHCIDPEEYNSYAPYPCDTIKALENKLCFCPPELLYKGDHMLNCGDDE